VIREGSPGVTVIVTTVGLAARSIATSMRAENSSPPPRSALHPVLAREALEKLRRHVGVVLPAHDAEAALDHRFERRRCVDDDAIRRPRLPRPSTAQQPRHRRRRRQARSATAARVSAQRYRKMVCREIGLSGTASIIVDHQRVAGARARCRAERIVMRRMKWAGTIGKFARRIGGRSGTAARPVEIPVDARRVAEPQRKMPTREVPVPSIRVAQPQSPASAKIATSVQAR
jgi:hypothetical protein